MATAARSNFRVPASKGDALLRMDSRRLQEVLRRGLAGDEHASFVRRLSG